MSDKDNEKSIKNIVLNYIKKNKNFFLNHPHLLNDLNFPPAVKHTEKVIDLNAYRSKKIQNDYKELKKQMSEIIKAGNSHLVSQKRILKTSLKILNSSTFSKLINVIVNDLGLLLDCDIVNCFFTSKKIKHSKVYQIDNKIASSFFNERPQTCLNQNPKGIPIFFPNKSRIIKSYILLKIIYNSDRFIIAMGSKNASKFTKNQKVDLIEYLIQITEIKLTQL